MAGQPPPYSSVVGSVGAGAGPALTSPVTGFCSTADTRVEVTDPVEQGEGLQAHVTYKVITTSTGTRFGWGRKEVIRRFRDFAFLRDQLVDKSPGVVVPPLPDKSVKMKMNQLYSEDDLKKRQRALQVFINRLVQSPTMGNQQELLNFLEYEETRWNEYYNSTKVSSRGHEAEKTTRKLLQSFKDLQHSAVNLFQGKSDDDQEPVDYQTAKRYYQDLERNLKDTYASAKNLIAKDEALDASLAEFCASAKALSKYEHGALQEAFYRMSARTEKICNLSLASSAAVASHFKAPLKEYVRYMEAVRAVMNARSTAFSRLQMAQSSLDKKKAKVDKVKTSPNSMPKLPEAEAKVQESDEALAAAKNEYDTISNNMASELGAFQAARGGEMSAVMREFALLMAQRHSESAQHWNGLVTELHALLPHHVQQ